MVKPCYLEWFYFKNEEMENQIDKKLGCLRIFWELCGYHALIDVGRDSENCQFPDRGVRADGSNNTDNDDVLLICCSFLVSAADCEVFVVHLLSCEVGVWYIGIICMVIEK